MLLGQKPRQLLGARAVLEERSGVDLLVGERAGATLPADQPERRVGDGGHRRQTQIDHGVQHLTPGGSYSTIAIARTGEPSEPSSLSGSATNWQRGARIWSRLVRYSITVMPTGKKIAAVDQEVQRSVDVRVGVGAEREQRALQRMTLGVRGHQLRRHLPAEVRPDQEAQIDDAHGLNGRRRERRPGSRSESYRPGAGSG